MTECFSTMKGSYKFTTGEEREVGIIEYTGMEATTGEKKRRKSVRLGEGAFPFPMVELLDVMAKYRIPLHATVNFFDYAVEFDWEVEDG